MIMPKAKLPLIIILVLLIISSFITFKFYSNNQVLSKTNTLLKKERSRLIEENNALMSKYRELGKENKELEERSKLIQEELSRLESEREDLQKRYEEVSKERESLVKRIKELTELGRIVGVDEKRPEEKEVPKEFTSDYWADVVKERAELRAMLEDLRKELINTKTNIAELEKENKELSIKIDEFIKEKEQLDMEMSFRERTLEIMSRDLVSEREARRKIANELAKLRNENMELKRELILANKESLTIQNKLRETIQKKEELERTVSDVENILKEKTLIFSELESKLTKAVKGKAFVTQESASIELPPIVVKPDTSVKALRGEVLAVNKSDNFVIIDLGEEAGVNPGFQFNVLRGESIIGSIEVIETRREIAAADITEVASSYSIREGDIVILK